MILAIFLRITMDLFTPVSIANVWPGGVFQLPVFTFLWPEMTFYTVSKVFWLGFR